MKGIVAVTSHAIVILLLILLLGANFIPAVAANQGDDGGIGGVVTSGVLVPQGGSPVPGGPGYVSIPGFTFFPYSPSYNFYRTGTYIVNQGSSPAYFDALVNLPNGATITKLIIYYYDNDATYDLSVFLSFLPFMDTTGTPIATFYSTGTRSSLTYGESTTINLPVVNLAAGSYALEATLPPSLNVRLNGVRVDYGFPVALPMINK